MLLIFSVWYAVMNVCVCVCVCVCEQDRAFEAEQWCVCTENVLFFVFISLGILFGQKESLVKNVNPTLQEVRESSLCSQKQFVFNVSYRRTYNESGKVTMVPKSNILFYFVLFYLLKWP